ncbi:Fe(3+)-hydroxamate ABC transporter substrate-binding protein FhuD [Escherichia coli]
MSGLPLISRRRLLTAMALSPLLWQMNTAHAAAIDPNRIVALEWLPVELLLALGIVPYGVADTINYRLWVSEPPLPESVIDVGLRTEPNLELLTEMKPSFMVWSAGYGPSPEMLARIAPGRGFNFSDGKQPLAMARKSLTEMADLLNLQSAAETHLAQYEDFIRSMKPRFVKRGARPLLLTTLIDPRHMLVFGPNSLFQEILMSTHLKCLARGNQLLGSTAVSIDRLAAYKDVDVLCFDHDNSKDMDALMATPLWQAMPFVRAGTLSAYPQSGFMVQRSRQCTLCAFWITPLEVKRE